MVITDYLEKNARIKPDDVSLVEINPALQPDHTVTWREYNLIESASGGRTARSCQRVTLNSSNIFLSKKIPRTGRGGVD